MADQITITTESGQSRSMSPDTFWAAWSKIPDDHPSKQRLLSEAMSSVGPPPTAPAVPAGLGPTLTDPGQIAFRPVPKQPPALTQDIPNPALSALATGMGRSLIPVDTPGAGIAGVLLPLLAARLPGGSMIANASKQALAGGATAAIGQAERGTTANLRELAMGSGIGAVTGALPGRFGSAAQSAAKRVGTERDVAGGLRSAYEQVRDFMGQRVPLTPGQDIQKEATGWAKVLIPDPDIANRTMGKQFAALQNKLLRSMTERPGTFKSGVAQRAAEMEFQQPGQLAKLLGTTPTGVQRLRDTFRKVEADEAVLEKLKARTTPGKAALDNALSIVGSLPLGKLSKGAHAIQAGRRALGGDVPPWMLDVARAGGAGAKILAAIANTRGVPEALAQQAMLRLYEQTKPTGDVAVQPQP